MKSDTPRQYAGLWLDSQHAMILTQQPDQETDLYSVMTKVASPEYHGGKGEHASNNAQQGLNHKYFKSIANLLLGYDEIWIIGPGKSQEQLFNFLSDDEHFKSKKISVDAAKQLTDPQLIALVSDYFRSKS